MAFAVYSCTSDHGLGTRPCECSTSTGVHVPAVLNEGQQILSSEKLLQIILAAGTVEKSLALDSYSRTVSMVLGLKNSHWLGPESTLAGKDL